MNDEATLGKPVTVDAPRAGEVVALVRIGEGAELDDGLRDAIARLREEMGVEVQGFGAGGTPTDWLDGCIPRPGTKNPTRPKLRVLA